MISPSASVIMMKPMPVARSDSTAKTAIEARPMVSAERIATDDRAGLQHVAGGVGGDAEQPGVAERHQPAIAGQHVQAEREEAENRI